MNYIKRAYKRSADKGYPKLYVVVDLHETIITPTYTKFNVGAEIYPHAAKVLQHWTENPAVCLILWTASHRDAVDDMLGRLGIHGIKFDYINENPEVPSGALCDFGAKLYFDICLDDKAGFEAEKDWEGIYNTLKELGEIKETF